MRSIALRYSFIGEEVAADFLLNVRPFLARQGPKKHTKADIPGALRRLFQLLQKEWDSCIQNG
jgi:hypothetical protein